MKQNLIKNFNRKLINIYLFGETLFYLDGEILDFKIKI
jgi:hypothetical protein